MTNKVTTVITEDGWTTTVEIDGKTFTEKHQRTRTGATCIEGDFEAEEEIPEELWNELSSLRNYDIMKALYDN
jgi:hypothetical protein